MARWTKRVFCCLLDPPFSLRELDNTARMLMSTDKLSPDSKSELFWPVREHGQREGPASRVCLGSLEQAPSKPGARSQMPVHSLRRLGTVCVS